MLSTCMLKGGDMARQRMRTLVVRNLEQCSTNVFITNLPAFVNEWTLCGSEAMN